MGLPFSRDIYISFSRLKILFSLFSPGARYPFVVSSYCL